MNYSRKNGCFSNRRIFSLCVCVCDRYIELSIQTDLVFFHKKKESMNQCFLSLSLLLVQFIHPYIYHHHHQYKNIIEISIWTYIFFLFSILFFLESVKKQPIILLLIQLRKWITFFFASFLFFCLFWNKENMFNKHIFYLLVFVSYIHRIIITVVVDVIIHSFINSFCVCVFFRGKFKYFYDSKVILGCPVLF